MDDELVSARASDDDRGREGEASTPLKSYEEIFNEYFPYYLSIGMTEEQYWDRDSTLTRAYRKAEDIRRDRKNLEMWLQGRYVYDAILRASPILHDFAKAGTKPIDYIEEPYPLTEKQREDQERKIEQREYELNKARMEQMMASVNKKFRKE